MAHIFVSTFAIVFLVWGSCPGFPKIPGVVPYYTRRTGEPPFVYQANPAGKKKGVWTQRSKAEALKMQARSLFQAPCFFDIYLLRLEQQDRAVTKVEVDEMLGLCWTRPHSGNSQLCSFRYFLWTGINGKRVGWPTSRIIITGTARFRVCV